MGSSHSNASSRELDLAAVAARAIYFVFGEPSIRYVHRRVSGPPIYDVTMDQDDDEASINRAETLQLPNAVTTKQDFWLSPVVCGNTFDGYKLSFRLSIDAASSDNDSSCSSSDDENNGEGNAGDRSAVIRRDSGSYDSDASANRGSASNRKTAKVAASQPFSSSPSARNWKKQKSLDSQRRRRADRRRQRFPKYICVYAGVKVCYIPGKGIHLEQDAASQPKPVVLDAATFDSATVQTVEPILLHKLCRSSFEEPPSGTTSAVACPVGRRLKTAPLCIVSRIACDGRPEKSDDDEDDSEEGTNASDSYDNDCSAQTAKTTEATTSAVSAERSRDTETNGRSASAGVGTLSEAVFENAEEEESEKEDGAVGNFCVRGPPSAACPRRAAAKLSNTKSRSTSKSSRAKPKTTTAAQRARRRNGKPTTFDIVLFTFLDFPEEAYEPKRVDTSSLSSLPPASATTTGNPSSAAQRQEMESAINQPLMVKGHAVKQLLQIGTEVYELEDIFDLGATDGETNATVADGDAAVGAGDGLADEDDDDANLCVICMTNPKDTTILPCRHMCLCYDCASQVRLSTNKCPICRCAIERVITI